MGPKVSISATSAAPVATVLARRAMATFPPQRRSPMIPEPTTVASKSPVPKASATTRRRSSTAAATAGLRGLGVRNPRNAAAALAGWLLHHGNLTLYDEHLPGIAVGILDPHLVLKRVAAFGVFFGERLEPRRLEPGPGCRDVLAAGDLHAKVAGVDAGARGFLHRQIEVWLDEVEFGVPRAAFRRLRREDLLVEGDGGVDVRDVEGDVRLDDVHVWVPCAVSSKPSRLCHACSSPPRENR